MHVLEKHPFIAWFLEISHDPPVIRSDRRVTVEQSVSLGREERAAHTVANLLRLTGILLVSPGRKWRPSPPTARTPRHLSLLTEAIQLLRKRLVRRLCSHGRDESLWADSPRRALAASAASARVAAFCASEQLRPCPRCHAINMTCLATDPPYRLYEAMKESLCTHF